MLLNSQYFSNFISPIYSPVISPFSIMWSCVLLHNFTISISPWYSHCVPMFVYIWLCIYVYIMVMYVFHMAKFPGFSHGFSTPRFRRAMPRLASCGVPRPPGLRGQCARRASRPPRWCPAGVQRREALRRGRRWAPAPDFMEFTEIFEQNMWIWHGRSWFNML